MPMSLPPETEIIPIEDVVFCQMYKHTGVLREGGNIIAPDMCREEAFYAKVVSVGPGKTIDYQDDKKESVHLPMWVEPGDNVIFARFHGERVDIGGKIYVLMRMDDIMSKVRLPEGKESTYFTLAETGGEGDKEIQAAIDRFRTPA